MEIDGIVFIPDQPDEHFDELVGFHEKRSDVPIILFDVYFNTAACDARTLARLPSFVGGDEQVGGKMAADIAAQAVGLTAASEPTVLIVNGGTAPWEQQRAIFFRNRLRELAASVNFLESPSFNYDRQSAFEHVSQEIARLASHGRLVGLDIIFACNDDMAIGARGAVARAVRQGVTFRSVPQIVGYDGTEEIRQYLVSGDAYIAGTVDVRIGEQAKQAMLLMHKLIRNRQRSSEVKLIAPLALRRT